MPSQVTLDNIDCQGGAVACRVIAISSIRNGIARWIDVDLAPHKRVRNLDILTSEKAGADLCSRDLRILPDAVTGSRFGASCGSRADYDEHCGNRCGGRERPSSHLGCPQASGFGPACSRVVTICVCPSTAWQFSLLPSLSAVLARLSRFPQPRTTSRATAPSYAVSLHSESATR